MLRTLRSGPTGGRSESCAGHHGKHSGGWQSCSKPLRWGLRGLIRPGSHERCAYPRASPCARGPLNG
eukprot:974096-Alexandrium_andersonii.AAC.1